MHYRKSIQKYPEISQDIQGYRKTYLSSQVSKGLFHRCQTVAIVAEAKTAREAVTLD